MAHHAAPFDFHPNTALITITTFPLSFTNLVPAFFQRFSLYFVFKYEFPISHAHTSRFLRAAIVKAIWAPYLETKIE